MNLLGGGVFTDQGVGLAHSLVEHAVAAVSALAAARIEDAAVREVVLLRLDQGRPRPARRGCRPIPPNPSELLGSEAMTHLLHRLEQRFDYVVIDAPPLLPVTDGAVLSKVSDGTIVVVGAKIVKREHLSRALTTLENVDAHVLGLVMNRLPVNRTDSYTYYRDGYRPETEEANRRGRKARTKETKRRAAARA